MFLTPDGFNCEELNPKDHAPSMGGVLPLQVLRWKILDAEWRNLELIGALPEGVYFGFGVSDLPSEQIEMIGADAQIAVSGFTQITQFTVFVLVLLVTLILTCSVLLVGTLTKGYGQWHTLSVRCFPDQLLC